MMELLRHGEEKNWIGGENNLLKYRKKFDFPVHKPIGDLTDKQYKLLWEGNEYAYGINDFLKK